MIRGIYTAATGMLAEQYVQESLAGNLANINTVGFKQDLPSFRALHEMAIRRVGGADPLAATPTDTVGTGVAYAGSTVDMSNGPLMRTDVKTDIALSGPGYFALQTPNGERYSRAGRFHLDGTSQTGVYLVDPAGNRLLGKSGPINLKGSEDFSVTPDGRVMSRGVEVDRLKLVDFPAAFVRKEGESLVSTTAALTAARPSVRQGFLEQSNVNAVTAMVKMITVQRAYEAAAKAVSAQDESLGKVVNDVGRV